MKNNLRTYITKAGDGENSIVYRGDKEYIEVLEEHIESESEIKEQIFDLLEYAWGVIANAHEGNWDNATEDWQEAAKRWRTEYHKMLDKRPESIYEIVSECMKQLIRPTMSDDQMVPRCR